MAKRNLSLKLLVDKKNQKVLFAEAGKEVVDFLFSLLALPVGTAARLLSAKGMVGSVGKLYDSVVRMDATYMQSGFDKNTLLEPSISTNSSCHSTFLLECSDSPSAKFYYKCRYASYTESPCNKHVTDGQSVSCPNCKNSMTLEMTYVPPKPELVVAGDGGGYVKGVVTYMVMDDLAVEPMSTISSITLLNKFHIKEVGSLEERTVELGMEEGLKLLKASLQSKTVLTDVFMARTAF